MSEKTTGSGIILILCITNVIIHIHVCTDFQWPQVAIMHPLTYCYKAVDLSYLIYKTFFASQCFFQ